MPTKRFQYEPIQPGTDWALTLRVTNFALCPVGSTFKASVRECGGCRILASLSSEAGTLNRLDDNALVMQIKGTASLKWVAPQVMLDVVRTDVTPHKHTGLRLEIPVRPIMPSDCQ